MNPIFEHYTRRRRRRQNTYLLLLLHVLVLIVSLSLSLSLSLHKEMSFFLLLYTNPPALYDFHIIINMCQFIYIYINILEKPNIV